MADTKISALPASTTPLAGTETLPIVQSGVTKKVSVADLTAGRAVASAGGTFSDNFTQGTAAKGVNFTANTPAAGMTSQLLNWYEEGTWTPTVKVNNAGAAIGITLYEGTYTRVGRLVFAQFRIARNDASALTGSVTWSLPIASGNATYFVSGSWWNASTNISGTVDINNYAASIANGGITAGGYLTYANFANGDNLCVSMVYQA